MRLTYFALCLLALGAHSIAAPTDEINSKSTKAIDYRLQETVWPTLYDVRLEPFLLESDGLNQFKFNGQVFITMHTEQKNLTTITLHAKAIDIKKSSFYQAANKTNIIAITIGKSDLDTDKMDITLATALEAGVDYILEVEYMGVLGDDMHGFYRSNYRNENNEEIWIASTQFQTNHARRAFPSFDEPKFKAEFIVEITHPSKYNVVSNTKIQLETPLPNSKTITLFKKTPKMSSYLLAFIVSDFRARDTNANGFAVIARPDAFSQTEYAYNVGPKLLASLDNFTAYPYKDHKLEKMDLAAIPDFSAGAMENWGLLTYRETALLYDPQVSTLLSQQRIASVISHELGHMWFGDLVTCDWWGYTWLNEGFGRYFQYFTTHAVESSWELDKQFVVEQIQSVMNMDSLSGTTPMSDPSAASPADLSRMFNSISYNKGATIIRMVKHMMTEDKFKTALQKYLKANDFSTTVPQKLFDAFNGEWTSDVDLPALLKDWTEQVGYPVVTVNMNADGKSFNVSQKRFLLRTDAGDANLLWKIPFTYTTSADINFSNTLPTVYLDKTQDEKTITLSKEATWVVANIQETGYYRVNYDTKTWLAIRKALGTEGYGGIHELNRAQIVDDVLNFGRSGLITYIQMVGIVDYLKTETNYLPWYSAFTGFSYLANRLGSENEKEFAAYILDHLTNVYNSVGFVRNSTETRLITYNRALVLAWACKYGHKACISDSKKAFQGLVANNVSVEVNIRSVVYCTAVREGTTADFEYLWSRFKTENVASEQVLILTALGCTSDKTLLQDYMNRIMSNDVRLQDKLSAFQGTFTSSAINVQTAFDYVTGNLKKMFDAFGSKTTVANIVSNIASRFTTTKQKEALETFIKDNGAAFETAVTTLNNAQKDVEFNLNWSGTTLKPFLSHLRGSSVSLSASTLLLFLTSYVVLSMFR